MEFDSFRGDLRKSGLVSHQQIFSQEISQSTATKHDGCTVLFAVAELHVCILLWCHFIVTWCGGPGVIEASSLGLYLPSVL